MFVNDLVVRVYGFEEYRLLQPLKYDGSEFVYIPIGFSTDFASVPRAFRWFMDGHGASRRPAVLHDYLYRKGIGTRAKADRLFLEALIGEGMPKWKARLAYLGVRIGGRGAWQGS